MKVSSKNNSAHYKGKTRLFKGKTKYILLLIPAILLLTGILATTLAPSHVTAMPSSTNNPTGFSLNANTVSTLAGSSGGMSINGNLTTNGSTLLNGNLNLTNAQQVTLGSPLIQLGAMNITADKIEIGKPSNQNGSILMSGNPSTVDLYGNILVGDPTTANGMYMNVTNFNQTIESQGVGYIGSIGTNSTLPVNTNTAIKVLQGTVYIGTFPSTPLMTINSTNCTILGLTVSLENYSGIANASQILIDNGAGGLVQPGGTTLPSNALWWNQSTTFQAWGDPTGPSSFFAISSGYISVTDTHIHMVANGLVNYTFLNTSSQAGIVITPGAQKFTRAEMDAVTPIQVITGLGSTYITNGNLSMAGITLVPQQQIINGKLDFTGAMTITGSFALSGQSLMKAPIDIYASPLNINGGTMRGTGNVTIGISDGYLQTDGSMIMNNGSITSGSPTVINGDLTLSGTVVNSGLVTMSGTFQLMIPLSITGAMTTIGVTSMGSLGTINGILTTMGNIILSGQTLISGVNNVIGSVTISSSGLAINGVVGLTGLVSTSNTPMISSSTILQIPSGSLMGLPISNISIQYSPLGLVALGIMAIGTIFVVARGIYIGYQDRRMLVQIPGVMLIMLRERFARLRKAFSRSSGGSKSEENTESE
ncbi:MAG: hypothetical protein WED07_10255 [Candidatus Freyarchaeum deiterrae]